MVVRVTVVVRMATVDVAVIVGVEGANQEEGRQHPAQRPPHGQVERAKGHCGVRNEVQKPHSEDQATHETEQPLHPLVGEMHQAGKRSAQ